MGERERLALFNMISGYLPGAMVLDAFAGSGALGIEALSRGADSVVFVEANRKAVGCIYDNLSALNISTDGDHGEHSVTVEGKKLTDNRHDECAVQDKDEPKVRALAAIGSSEIAKVFCSRVQEYNTRQRFDVILADPPYNGYDAKEIESLIPLLKPGGLLVLSHPGNIPTLSRLNLVKSRKYAGATISVFSYH